MHGVTLAEMHGNFVDADPIGGVVPSHSVDAAPVPHASKSSLDTAADLEHELIAERPVAIGALLTATALLRIGTVGASLSVGFELVDRGRVDPRIIGIVGSINLVSELIFAPILARFADRFGRTRFLIGGPLVGALGLILLTFATRPFWMASSRLLEGIAAAAFVPTALGTIAAATSHSTKVRSNAGGAFEACTLAGYAVGGLLSGFVHHWTHRYSFLVFAFFYVAAALVCWHWIPRVPPLPVSPIRAIVRAVLSRGPIRTFLPAWLATFAAIGAMLVNMPPLLKSGAAAQSGQLLAHRLDERLVSEFITAGLLLLVVGIALWTPLLIRIGAARTMRRAIPGAWVFCAGLLALNHTSMDATASFVLVLVAGILILSGFGPAAVVYLAECSETFVADRSALMAFYTLTLAAGGLVGGIVGGFAANWLQIDGLTALCVGLSVFAFVALSRVVSYERALVRDFDGD